MKSTKVKSLFERSNRLVNALDDLYKHNSFLSKVVEHKGGDSSSLAAIGNTLNILESQIRDVMGQIFENDFVDDGSSQEVWDEVDRMRAPTSLPQRKPSSVRDSIAAGDPTAMPHEKPMSVRRRGMEAPEGMEDVPSDMWSASGEGTRTEIIPTPRRKPDSINTRYHKDKRSIPKDMEDVPDDMWSASGESTFRYNEEIERIRVLANISENDRHANRSPNTMSQDDLGSHGTEEPGNLKDIGSSYAKMKAGREDELSSGEKGAQDFGLVADTMSGVGPDDDIFSGEITKRVIDDVSSRGGAGRYDREHQRRMDDNTAKRIKNFVTPKKDRQRLSRD